MCEPKTSQSIAGASPAHRQHTNRIRNAVEVNLAGPGLLLVLAGGISRPPVQVLAPRGAGTSKWEHGTFATLTDFSLHRIQ